MRISVFASKELQAILLTTRELPKEVASRVNKQTKLAADPIWKAEVGQHVHTRLEARVLGSTAVTAVGRNNVTLRAGHKGKALSGGYRPAQLAHHVEFGADQNFTRSYEATSRKGRHYTVHNRHTRRQFRPRNLKGYVVYPAAAGSIPRLASLWFQTVVRATHEAFESR